IHADLLVGVLPAGVRHAITHNDFAATSNIGALSIHGYPAAPTTASRFMQDANISAAVIGWLDIYNVDFASSIVYYAAPPFGNLNHVYYLEFANQTFYWTYPTPPSPLGPPPGFLV